MLTEINVLSKEEFKRFGEFIYSPYFNRYLTIRKLYQFLKKVYPGINNSFASIRNISLYVYGEEKPNTVKIRKLVSDFKLLFEKFLLCGEVLNDNAESRLKLLAALRKKFLMELYAAKLESMKDLTDSEFGMDAEFYLNKMNYFDELFTYYFTVGNAKAEQYSVKKIQYLNYYSIYKNLVYNYNFHSDIMNHGKSAKLQENLIGEVYRIIEKNKKLFEDKFPDIITLYYGNLMFVSSDERYYHKLLKYYQKNKSKFNSNLHTMYYILSENFLKKISWKFKKQEYERKLFDLRKTLFDDGHYEKFLTEGRNMLSSDFFRIFIDAVNLKEFDWAESFVKSTNKYLLQNERAELTKLTLAIVNFFKKDYPGIAETINETGKKNVYFYVYSRFLKMMYLYERGDYTSVNFEAEAFRKFYTRNLNKEGRLKSLYEKCKVFLSRIQYLYMLNQKSKYSGKKKFMNYESGIPAKNNAPLFRFWFEEKIKELEKRNK